MVGSISKCTVFQFLKLAYTTIGKFELIGKMMLCYLSGLVNTMEESQLASQIKSEPEFSKNSTVSSHQSTSADSIVFENKLLGKLFQYFSGQDRPCADYVLEIFYGIMSVNVQLAILILVSCFPPKKLIQISGLSRTIFHFFQDFLHQSFKTFPELSRTFTQLYKQQQQNFFFAK